MNRGWLARRGTRRFLIAVVLLAGAGFFALGLFRGLNVFDEGLGLVGADRVIHGELPYRDFWGIYGPGGYYLFGGLFLLVGPSVVAARLLTAAIMLAAALMIYLIARRLSNSAYGLAAYLVALVWFGYQPLHARAMAPALLLAFVFLRAGVDALDRGTPWRFFMLGGWSGMILLFRHDLGLEALVAALAVLVWRSLRMTPEAGDAERPGASLSRDAGCVLAGALAIALPMAVVLLASMPARILWAQLFGIHFSDFSSYWTVALPLPFVPRGGFSSPGLLRNVLRAGWESVNFYVPPAILAVVGFRLVFRRKPRAIPFRDGVALLVAMGGAFCVYAVHRLDKEHIIPVSLIALLLLAALAASSPGRWWRVAFAAFALASASLPVFIKVQTLIAPRETGLLTLRIPRGAGIKVPAGWGRNLEDAVRFLDERTAPDERIFVACPRHDRIFINDAMFYFLAGRLPGTRFQELPRGIATKEAGQRQIIEDLILHKVRYVVVSDAREADESKEENRSRGEAGSLLLDEYLQTRFRLVAHFGDYKILEKFEFDIRVEDHLPPFFVGRHFIGPSPEHLFCYRHSRFEDS